MKVYLAGSISGGRKYAEGIKSIYSILLECGHEVLTPFVADETVNNARFPGLIGQRRAEAIFDEDVNLLEKANIAICEVSQPSTGLGMELGVLIGMARYLGIQKPTLTLRHESLKNLRSSYLVNGNRYANEVVYYNQDSLNEIVKRFLRGADIEGKIIGERSR